MIDNDTGQLLIFISALIVNNIVLMKFLALCSSAKANVRHRRMTARRWASLASSGTKLGGYHSTRGIALFKRWQMPMKVPLVPSHQYQQAIEQQGGADDFVCQREGRGGEFCHGLFSGPWSAG